MNKTPIQELIDSLDGILSASAKDLYLEKEKQFGVDCFEAGFKNRHWVSAGDGDRAFNRFYSQYTQQQKTITCFVS